LYVPKFHTNLRNSFHHTFHDPTLNGTNTDPTSKLTGCHADAVNGRKLKYNVGVS